MLEIIDSLTFKTLSLGFCIKAVDMWVKNFNDIGNKSTCSFILKISGIWETQYNYGLTYKFIKIN
jgi:hypothetical protein